MSTASVLDFCEHCGAYFSAATQIGPDENGATPPPGDVTCCAYCFKFSVYTDEGVTRKMSKDEFEALDEETKGVLVNASNVLKRASLSKSAIKGKA